jgi:hypothetical protein
MGVIYRFTVTGKNGSTMGGYTVGDYTVEQALTWALDDLATGRAIPDLIAADGALVYDAAAIQEAYVERPLPAELLDRLVAVGGAWTGQGPSRWGSYEILTPAHAHEKYLWCTPLALSGLLDEWEALGGCHPRLATLFAAAAGKLTR